MKRYACFLLLAITASAAVPAVAEPRPDFATMRQREGDDLALILGLSAAQRPALAAFLAADAPPEPPMTRPDAPQGFEQRLAEQERRIGERTADDRKRLSAARAFYAALDTRQRSVFEAVMRLRHGPGGPGPHGPHGPSDGPDGPPDGTPHGPPNGPQGQPDRPHGPSNGPGPDRN